MDRIYDTAVHCNIDLTKKHSVKILKGVIKTIKRVMYCVQKSITTTRNRRDRRRSEAHANCTSFDPQNALVSCYVHYRMRAFTPCSRHLPSCSLSSAHVTTTMISGHYWRRATSHLSLIVTRKDGRPDFVGFRRRRHTHRWIIAPTHRRVAWSANRREDGCRVLRSRCHRRKESDIFVRRVKKKKNQKKLAFFFFLKNTIINRGYLRPLRVCYSNEPTKRLRSSHVHRPHTAVVVVARKNRSLRRDNVHARKQNNIISSWKRVAAAAAAAHT